MSGPSEATIQAIQKDIEASRLRGFNEAEAKFDEERRLRVEAEAKFDEERRLRVEAEAKFDEERRLRVETEAKIQEQAEIREPVVVDETEHETVVRWRVRWRAGRRVRVCSRQTWMRTSKFRLSLTLGMPTTATQISPSYSSTPVSRLVVVRSLSISVVRPTVGTESRQKEF